MSTETTGQEQAVYAVLDALRIAYTRHEHPPVFTVEEAEQHWQGIDAVHCKNLFVRNKKGNAHYLVVVERSKMVDMKRLTTKLNEDRLSFASPERLATHLGLTPGAVSPFGIINNRDHAVAIVLDEDLRSAERVAFHPNVNTATIALSFADFERFLASRGNPVRYLVFSPAATSPEPLPDPRS
jgi:Ala-tRNA(Pro) deacylase